MKPPAKASNDPSSKITAPGDMLIFINGVPPIYGFQSLYFLEPTLLARTKLKPPKFPTAATLVKATNNPASTTDLDIAAIVSDAVDRSSIEEHLNGNI